MPKSRQLWKSVRARIPPDTRRATDTAPTRTRVNLTVQRQPPNSKWCWAMVSSSVSKFFSASSTWTPCAVAAAETRQVCCTPPLPPPACDKDWSLQRALERTLNLANYRETHLRKAAIRSELARGKPVCLRVRWKDDSGHFLIIVGLTEDSSDPTVHVSDPAFGESNWPLSALIASYRGTGAWTHSYLTKA